MTKTPSMQTLRSAQHPGTADSLPAFLEFIDEACAEAGTNDDATLALRLAVEEVCLNLMRYGYAGMPPDLIAIDFGVDGDAVTLTVRDRARPFDPGDAPEPDLVSDAATRPVGGLGWFLVKQMMDEISYCSDPQQGNRLTLRKRAAIKRKER